MAKTNGDPMSVADAARNGMFNGQIAGADGPKTMAPIKDQTGLDRDRYGSTDNGASDTKK